MRLLNWFRHEPLTLADLAEGEWIKSRKSGPQGNCVQVSRYGAGVQVRDSKDPDGPKLTFTGPEWRAFVDDIDTFNLKRKK